MARLDRPAAPMPLARSDSFASRTVEAVRELILGGHYQPGDRINEVELATALGISRAPLREALQGLTSEGLVVRVTNRGTFIPRFGNDEILELFELREALEVMGARLAAERADEEGLVRLSDVLERTKRALDAGSASPYPRELDFHEVLIGLARNGKVLDRVREVHRQLQLARARSGFQPERARQAYDEHLAVLDAVVRHDPSGAEAAMRAHLRTGLAHVQQLFRTPDVTAGT